MDEIGRAYLLLALNLERHLEGFVDAYFGPLELKTQAQAGEPRPLDALADDARQLVAAVEASDYDPQRRDFLRRQVGAMAAVVRNLSGPQLGFSEEVELYFDITPEMTDEAVFAAAHAELARLLPGDAIGRASRLVDRLVAWRKRLELAPDRIFPVFELARQETRRRTRALFDLPGGEELSQRLVKDQPWAAYNWYLGNYQSRIEINTDLPVRASSAVPLMAHEAYAGHHTEHAIKEAARYQAQDRAEHCIQLLLAPECVLSEGIADSALDVIWNRADRAAFLRDELYPAAGLPGIDVGLQLQIERAAEALRHVDGNAALLVHRGLETELVAQRLGYRRHQPLAACDRGQRAKEHAVLKAPGLHHPLGGLQCQARLARAAGPQQSEQPAGRILQPGADLLQLLLAPHKGRGLGRQVVAGGRPGARHRPQHTPRRRQSGPDLLVQGGRLGVGR